MEERYKSRLEENGADVANTIRRFMGKEEIYEKYLIKFLQEPNYENLMANLENKNYSEAFRCVHAQA